jgi:microcystin-dependent protein
MDEFIGIVKIFAGNFAPRGWALCQGQLLSIAQNTALFSILGTTYGGDGRVTFGLPDLRGRVPIGAGQGPNLTNRTLGEQNGEETVLLDQTTIPPHTHLVNASSSGGANKNPSGAVPGNNGSYNPTADAVMSPSMLQPTGGGLPHNNMQPFLVINYIICMEGLFPSRN